MKKLSYIFVIIFLFFFLAIGAEKVYYKSFSDIIPMGLYNSNRVVAQDGKKGFSISDLTYDKSDLDKKTDIILSFNKEAKKVKKDDSGTYTILKSNYILSKDSDSIGNGSAKFFKKDDGVVIQGAEGGWLGKCGDLGSFTIEFRFKLLSVDNGTILFSRNDDISGKRVGMEIKMKQGRISFFLNSVFKDVSGKPINIYLSGGQLIHRKKWYHFAIGYDRLNGKLTKYINGDEDESIYVTNNGESYGTPLIPSIGTIGEYCNEAATTVIGHSMVGFIDEFRIYLAPYEKLNLDRDIATSKYRKVQNFGRTVMSNEGIVVSPVSSFPSTGSLVKSFRWEEKLPEGTYVRMEFRISDNLFDWDNSDLKWYRVSNGQQGIYLKKGDDGNFLRGKYYQWRAFLISSPDGTQSPFLYNPEIFYKTDEPPHAPRHLEVINTGDKYLTLKWRANVDGDISGYNIYYGYNKNRFDGVIKSVNGKRIDNSLAVDGYITIKIDNSLINNNMNHSKKTVMDYPLLKNGALYFFAVSAYDSYRVGTVYNHESSFSEMVDARPHLSSEF